MGTLHIISKDEAETMGVQCHLDYTEKYDLDYTENKAHSLGVRKIVRVLSGKLSNRIIQVALYLRWIGVQHKCSY